MKKFFSSPVVVGVLMALLCIGAACAIFFGLIQPAQTQLASETSRFQVNAAYYGDDNYQPKLKAAQSQLKDAQHSVAVVQTQWGAIQTAKNPVIDFSDRLRAWYEYNGEARFDFSQRLNAFLAHTGVKPMTKVGPLQTSSDPNQPPARLIFEEQLGTISVFGSYAQIANHLKAWNKFDRIVLLDGLNLTGYNPFITAQYSATEFIFTQNSDKPGPNVGVGAGIADNTNATFETVPEYQVHIQNPTLPTISAQNPGAAPGGGGFGGQGGPGGPPPGFGGGGGGGPGGPPANFRPPGPGGAPSGP